MRISAAGNVTPSSSKSPSSTTCAAAHRHVGHDRLRDILLPDAHHRDAVGGRATQPCESAKGPTAAVRLPQLPDQSTSARSMATWPKR